MAVVRWAKGDGRTAAIYSVKMQSSAANAGADMTRTYVQVVIVEIVVLAFLWWLGLYSA